MPSGSAVRRRPSPPGRTWSASGDTLWSIAARFAPASDPRGRRSPPSRPPTAWIPATWCRDSDCPSRPWGSASTDGFDHPTSCGYRARGHHMLWPHDMRCPWCGADDDRVVDSTPRRRRTAAIRRRRRCATCGRRYLDLRADRGRRPRRSQAGRLKGPVRAGEGQGGDPQGDQEQTGLGVPGGASSSTGSRSGCAGRVRRSPRSRSGSRCSSSCAKLDEVAYIRFASVYKDFQEITDFERELGTLLKREPAKRRKR